MCLTSAFLFAPRAAAEPAAPRIAEAGRLYFEGKAIRARENLVRLLEGPDARDPQTRLAVLTTLIDICIHSYAETCVQRYAPEYVELARVAPAPNDMLKAEQVRRAAYYFDWARLTLNRPEVTDRILDGEFWSHENPYNGALYLQRRLLASDVLLAQGKRTAAMAEVDRILSLIASARNPQAARFTLAYALTDVIRTLLELGQVERAYGLYMAGGGFMAAELGGHSVDAAVFRLTEAQVLEAVGDLDGAARASGLAAATLRGLEIDADTRDGLLADVLTLRAAVCAMRSDLDCAREAIRTHPFAVLYAQVGRAPASEAEVLYLGARALVGAVGRTPDAVAAQALAAPAAFTPEDDRQAWVAAVRAAGTALAEEPGPKRAAGLLELGRRMRTAANADAALPGAWYRPSAVERLLIALALTQVETAAPGDVFALTQVAMRVGPTFDADALTALGSARDELQRRTIHEALRLRARRDRLEREQVRAVVTRAGDTADTSPVLGYDPDARRVFRDFANRIAEAERGLAKDGVPLAGANIAPLDRFQAGLRADEAALQVAPTAGGLAYMCIRRDRVFQTIAPVDANRLVLDGKLLQAALTATHAPSEDLDVQFPAEASVRLYDVLIRPFSPCLKTGDRIIWLPGVAAFGLPLEALVPAPPPKLARGYDLGAADWLVRHHAISYAGSAAAVVAARSGGASRRGGGFDFLGVGDPLLTGQTVEGQARGKAVLRGVRSGSGLAELAPLPETRDELEASARGFAKARVLLSGDATERGFRGELVGAYGLLSFATHGLIRDDLEGLSEPALVLTPVSEADPMDDGLLTASEIADLNLSARFVALSACNTANFDLGQMSQDLPALASAFAVAGAPATLATLWPVNSESGKRVVTGVFERLRGGEDPAQALAAAQRAFLAAPPGLAYLHPRFWAPFVVLGDGGVTGTPVDDGAPALIAVETLTRGGGEVLEARRTRDGVIATFISDPDASGRHRAGVRVTGGRTWRRDIAGQGAGDLVAETDRAIVVGGYAADAAGRIAPRLDVLDRKTGTSLGAWMSDAAGADFAAVLAAAASGPGRPLFVTGDVVRKDRAPPAVRVFQLDARLDPQLLFETHAPAGVQVGNATVLRLGPDVVLTFTDRSVRPKVPPDYPLDDYDHPLCSGEPVTWIELRDGRTGALKASQEVRGLRVERSLSQDGRVLLGGATRRDCGSEARAAVLVLDPQGLATRTLYQDDSPGMSIAWSLNRLPGGRLFVGASKQTVLDLGPGPGRTGTRGVYRVQDLQQANGGMVVVLDQDGKASPPRMLESGAGVFVDGADTSRPDDILLGGSLGGEAAIFHLSDRPGG